MIKNLDFIANEYLNIPDRKYYPLSVECRFPHKSMTDDWRSYDNIHVDNDWNTYACMGVQWETEDGKKIKLLDSNTGGINTYPTKDFELLIAVYQKNSKLFPYPNNIVVYNSNGSVRHVILAPELETDFTFGYKKIISAERGFCFAIGWMDDVLMDERYAGIEPNDRHVVLKLTDITTNGMSVWEERIFDAYEGVFVKTIVSERIIHEGR